jgi:2'-5' RNA ligase
MRLFTAIDLSREIQARLGALADRLRPLANLRWSPVENLHVTTKFIGEWPPERLGELEGALERIPKPGPVEIAVRGLGWFPNPHNPRVFWAGVQPDSALAALAAAAGQALAEIGVPEEDREFHPHVTLARTRDRLSKESLGALRRAVAAEESPEFGSFRAGTHVLYLSAGGRYTRLRQCSLLPS